MIIPLRKVCAKDKEMILSANDIRAIFSNIQQLIPMHEDLQQKLHKSAKMWPSCSNIGEIFLEGMVGENYIVVMITRKVR